MKAFIHIPIALCEPYPDVNSRTGRGFITHCERYLCFSLVVEREDIVSPACLALSDQKHSVPLRSGALNQVRCLDPGDGPVEPGVGEQEVVSLLDNLLWQGKRDWAWRVAQKNNIQLESVLLKITTHLLTE